MRNRSWSCGGSRRLVGAALCVVASGCLEGDDGVLSKMPWPGPGPAADTPPDEVDAMGISAAYPILYGTGTVHGGRIWSRTGAGWTEGTRVTTIATFAPADETTFWASRQVSATDRHVARIGFDGTVYAMPPEVAGSNGWRIASRGGTLLAYNQTIGYLVQNDVATQVPGAPGDVYPLHMVAPGEGWGVISGNQLQLLHFAGSSWTTVESLPPSPLHQFASSGSADVWLITGSLVVNWPNDTLRMPGEPVSLWHWDGSTWTEAMVSVPTDAGAAARTAYQSTAIVSGGPGEVWVVGREYVAMAPGNAYTFVAHRWDGSNLVERTKLVTCKGIQGMRAGRIFQLDDGAVLAACPDDGIYLGRL